jgi:hypothetical protein
MAGATAPFVPWDLTGCAAAYRSDLDVTVGGGTVSAWGDQTGNARHLLQAVAAKQPVFAAAAGPNGTDAIQFDGVNDVMRCATWGQTQPTFVFAIAKPSASNDTAGTMFDGAPTGNTLRGSCAGAWAFTLYAGVYLVSAAGSRNVWRELRCTFNGVSSQLIVDDSTTNGNAGTANAGGLTVGCFGNGSADPGDCELAEIAVFSGVRSANEMTLLDWYAGVRYGL